MQHHLGDDEIRHYQDLVAQLKNTPIPDNEVLANLGLFLTRSSLGRILFLAELYQKILNTHGVIMEMGVRWGQNLALFSALRSIYEPFNISRRIIGFDTFEGFPHVSEQDGQGDKARVGAYDVVPGYESILEQILASNEALNPKTNVRKFELVKGDILESLPSYLDEHPETLVSMVYLDLDLYEPTLAALKALMPYCSKGTIFAFDELCYADFPGETRAMREVLGKRPFRVIRSPISAMQSYVELC